MPRALELRQAHEALWERTVGHPFVLALGDGTLPRGVFADYMVQDYLFIDFRSPSKPSVAPQQVSLSSRPVRMLHQSPSTKLG